MAVSLNVSHLKRILPNLKEPELDFEHLEKALIEFGIGERDEVAQFLGQVGGETDGGRYFTELYNNPPGKEAYFRSFLGGQWKYHGHGAIHLTWRDAYEECAAYFLNPKILKDPDVVSTAPWRWRTAAWFFAVHKDITKPARHANFDEVMRLVLGSSSHPSRRKRWGYYVKACQTLPIPWRLNGELRTRADRTLDYLWPALNLVDYDWWVKGNVPSGPMAYAVNREPPDIEQVIRDDAMFCQAVGNLALRAIGKRVPTKGDPRFDGGIAAAFGGVYGPGYFHGYTEPFDPTGDYPHCTLVGSPFRGASSQGHTGIILGNGRILDCNSVDGLQARRWQGDSHARYGPYRVAVMPWNWCNYIGDEF